MTPIHRQRWDQTGSDLTDTLQRYSLRQPNLTTQLTTYTTFITRTVDRDITPMERDITPTRMPMTVNQSVNDLADSFQRHLQRQPKSTDRLTN